MRNFKATQAQKEEDEIHIQRLEKELEVDKHIVKCNPCITKLQETQSKVHKA